MSQRRINTLRAFRETVGEGSSEYFSSQRNPESVTYNPWRVSASADSESVGFGQIATCSFMWLENTGHGDTETQNNLTFTLDGDTPNTFVLPNQALLILMNINVTSLNITNASTGVADLNIFLAGQ